MNKRRRNRAKDTSAATKVIAWRIGDWCKALSISRAQYYILLARGGIEVIHLGTMPLVRTPPEEYLAWAAEQRANAEPASAAKRGGRRRVPLGEPASPLAARPNGSAG
jgi:hypothetical protein